MKATELLGKAAECLIGAIFALMMAYLFLMSIFSTCMIGVIPGEDSKTFYIGDHLIVHVLLIAVILWAGGCLYSKISLSGNVPAGKKYWLLAAYMAAGILFVGFTQLFPIADQRELLYAAENVKNGDFSDFFPGGYINTNPHQKGIFIYIYLFYSFFGDKAFIALQVVNVVWLVLSLSVLGEIAGELWGETNIAGLEGKVILTEMLFLPAFFFQPIFMEMFRERCWL